MPFSQTIMTIIIVTVGILSVIALLIIRRTLKKWNSYETLPTSVYCNLLHKEVSTNDICNSFKRMEDLPNEQSFNACVWCSHSQTINPNKLKPEFKM